MKPTLRVTSTNCRESSLVPRRGMTVPYKIKACCLLLKEAQLDEKPLSVMLRSEAT